MSSYKVETIIKNATYTVGEAPHWEGDTDTLLFVDLLAGNLHRYNTLTKIEERRHFGSPVTLVVPRKSGGSPVTLVVPQKSGGYIMTTGNNLNHLDWDTGHLTQLASVDTPVNKFNDGKCDETGRLWAGSVGPMTEPGKPVPEAGSLYSLETNLTVKKHDEKITLSNGMGWSSDNTTMYYIDSSTRVVWAYDFDMEAGTVSNRRDCIKFSEESFKTIGVPDGMTTDLDGKLWISFFFGSCVAQFDPETAKEITRVKLPASQITSCCWGGKNYDELYVTSASVTSATIKLDNETEKGSVFRVTNTGAKGKPAPVFMG